MFITQSGTVFVNDIEYNEYPPPSSIIKATKLEWAQKLRNEGKIYLHSFDYYQLLENPELGDKNEGQGLYYLNGHPMETGSSNEVFIWCGSLPATPYKYFVT